MVGIILMLGLAAMTACEVTPEKIARWKTSPDGAARLRAALVDPGLRPSLRAAAGEALVERGMLSEVEQGLATVAEPERTATVAALVPVLWRTARGDGGTDRAPSLDQVKAKDALYRLRESAAPPVRDTIDGELATWVCADLSRRAQAGGYGSAEILATIGPRAGAALAALLARQPRPRPADALLAAQLLGDVGDEGTRDQAVASFVGNGVSGSLAAADLRLVGYIGGPAAVRVLGAIALHPDDRRDDETLRLAALDALRERSEAPALAVGLTLAGDAKAPTAVRDSAFALVQKIGGPLALDGSLALVDDAVDSVRWEAIDSALATATVDALPRLLDALPVNRSYPRDDLMDLLCQPIVRRFGAFAVPPLRRELSSKSWIGRLAAVELLAELGGESDVALLAGLEADETRLPGWPRGATLGGEATLAVERLAQRQ